MAEELSRHDQKIKEFVDTDESRNWMHPRFRKPPRHFSLRGFYEFLKYGDEEQVEITITPDAWDIDFNERVIWLLEVVDTNPIGAFKLRQLADLFWFLDTEGFGLALVIYDIPLGVTVNVSPEQFQMWAIQGATGEPWKVVIEAEPEAEPTPSALP